MRSFFAVLALAFSSAAFGATELVMHEGVTIRAQKDGESITVRSGKEFDRTYEWDSCTLKSHMSARKDRWFGSMGIYDPDPLLRSLFLLRRCRGVVEEGQIHFDDLNFAYEWMRRSHRGGNVVWTNDGLLVAWGKVPGDSKSISVHVWLMCINGQRPMQLDGATDSAITVTTKLGANGIAECAAVGKDVIDQTRDQLEAYWREHDERLVQSRESQKQKLHQ